MPINLMGMRSGLASALSAKEAILQFIRVSLLNLCRSQGSYEGSRSLLLFAGEDGYDPQRVF